MGRILASIGFLIVVALVYLVFSGNAPTSLLSPTDTTSTTIHYVGSSTSDAKQAGSGGTPCTPDCIDGDAASHGAKRKEIGK